MINAITEETLQTGQMNRYVVAEDADVPVNTDCNRGSDDVSSRVIGLWSDFLGRIDRGKAINVFFEENDVKELNKEQAMMNAFIADKGVTGEDMNASAYSRIIENSIRLACLYAIAQNPEKQVLS